MNDESLLSRRVVEIQSLFCKSRASFLVGCRLWNCVVYGNHDSLFIVMLDVIVGHEYKRFFVLSFYSTFYACRMTTTVE